MHSTTQPKNERRLASGHCILILITLYRSLVVLYHFVKYLPINFIKLQIMYMKVRQREHKNNINTKKNRNFSFILCNLFGANANYRLHS